MFRRQQQRGFTFVSFLFTAAIVVFAAMLAMKLAPAYLEFFAIKKILHDIGSSPAIAGMSNAEIREKFGKRALIDRVSSIGVNDLDISRENGKPVAKAEYTFQTRLVGNVSLLVEFKASSQDGADNTAAAQ